MCRITYSIKRNQILIKKKQIKKFDLKYDVIYDTLKVICENNLERPRNSGDIGSFGDVGTCTNYD